MISAPSIHPAINANIYTSVKTRLQVRVQQQNLHDKEYSNGAANGSPIESQRNDAFYEILQILREDGVPGLYSGLESSIAGTASMNFAYFYWSAAARTLYQSILRSYGLEDSNNIMKELGLGAAGGAMAQLCTNPIAVISTRQQTRKAGEEKRSMWDTMMEILQSEDGWTGLWRGFKVNLILVINPMITYGVYQWLRGILVSIKKNIGSIDAFCMLAHALKCSQWLILNLGPVLGALSKVLATIATHPLIVAKTMLQSKPPPCREGKPFRGFTEVLAYIVRNEGIMRLYKGLAPQIIKGFLVQGLMMMLKERYGLTIPTSPRIQCHGDTD